MLKKRSSAGGIDKAELGQRLDPARGITLNGQRFIVGGGIPVVFAPLEHEEDGAENFVADGDDGAFVATSNEQGLKLRLEHGSRPAGGMSKLAEQAADIEIALADMAGFALAGGFIVSRTDAHPGSQTIRTAKGVHVGTDLDQQHGGADQIDAGDRLQQSQGIAFGFEFAEEASVETGDARLDLLDMLHQFVEDEAVTGCQITLQRVEDFLAAGQR